MEITNDSQKDMFEVLAVICNRRGGNVCVTEHELISLRKRGKLALELMKTASHEYQVYLHIIPLECGGTDGE